MILSEISQFPEINEIEDEDEFIHKLKNKKLSKEFMEKWNEFIENYGFRGPLEIDVATHRYYENPGRVFSLLKDMNKANNLNPIVVFQNGLERRRKTLVQLTNFLEKKSKSKLKKFIKNYKLVETFASFRETPKYYMVLGIDYIRRTGLKLAKKWIEAGRIDSENNSCQNFGQTWTSIKKKD